MHHVCAAVSARVQREDLLLIVGGGSSSAGRPAICSRLHSCLANRDDGLCWDGHLSE